MPHFVIDCSSAILTMHPEEVINEQIHLVANSAGLFDENDIKVRVNPFSTYIVGNQKQNFIHVFGNIMQGRTTEQKADLSQRMVSKLAELFPDVDNISMNINDFEKATYCNKKML
ncbi:5-carboxymethyl-2-hydroxymuconate Delta-isomerase [Psychrobium sp. 1_MG-2023]|uniref:5-carboxymethyl-2-hydroxymuconate Delta-isomerase n=1 Tax=Psychrobium sp. 1_MG-2023 TaxID=3062624 RepID=UPI000C328DF9|nr:5-carboxymethyl-2-hydroxymuconate Delta-isomerase [Psychrobium sp. 1_MG-2023]MDP2561504.1 5-carboxymethyl-2-hydroxymuconate Delta-isomerase [Psychrobium sp. 1_MG-2023]PKF57769.1 5-carboxymethyl-2-hydroxymuconate isomerase [Alteromonadales bacterium alter-6D02]